MGKNCTTRAKFLLKLFLKSLSCAAGETAVARRNERNFSSALFFLQSFLFWLEQERARWAMKRVRSTEKTRSVECDLAFKATMFLTGSLCQKKKRYRRRILFVGKGLAPPAALQSLRHFPAKMPPPFTQGRRFCGSHLVIWCRLS